LNIKNVNDILRIREDTIKILLDSIAPRTLRRWLSINEEDISILEIPPRKNHDISL
jgi:hypothetical protein